MHNKTWFWISNWKIQLFSNHKKTTTLWCGCCYWIKLEEAELDGLSLAYKLLWFRNIEGFETFSNVCCFGGQTRYQTTTVLLNYNPSALSDGVRDNINSDHYPFQLRSFIFALSSCVIAHNSLEVTQHTSRIKSHTSVVSTFFSKVC